MKVKKYVGATTQEVLGKLKKDLGPEAIILDTRTVKQKGLMGLFKKPLVEIVAAKDDDRKKVNLMKKQENISSIKNEIKELKDLMKEMSLNKDNQERNFNIKLEKYREILINQGVDYRIATIILNRIDKQVNIDEKTDDEIKKIIEFNLKEYIGDIEPLEISDIPKTIFFIGSTGVGKTTTLAKIAAQLVIKGDYELGLITADTYRIAAVEQLKIYSEILKLPVKVIYKPEEIYKAMAAFKTKDIILVDTAGRSHNDTFQMQEIKELLGSVKNKEVYLVLSAATDFATLKSIIYKYDFIDNYKIIFTKLDETNVYGNILNVKFYVDNPLSYFTTGQNVPDDIEIANVQKVVKYLIGEN